MSRILVVGDENCLLQPLAVAIEAAGHEVEIASDVFGARERLSGRPCDVVVIDVRRPDGGTGLLIEQTRAAWPCCAVLALVQRQDLRRTKVHEMGLWTPDAVLFHPVSDEDLVHAVAVLDGRQSGEERHKLRREAIS